MATNDAMRDPEFEAAFNEDTPAASGDAGGMELPEAGEGTQAEEAADAAETVSDSDDEGAPAAVVIVAEAPEGAEDASAEKAADDAAAKEAKQVNDAANDAASDNKSDEVSTGTKEAGGVKPASDEGSAAEEASESPQVEAAEQALDPETPAQEAAEAGGKKAPMSEQQLRSWEGRLKKMEADLRSKASSTGETPAETTSDALEEVADQADAAGDSQKASTVEEVADQVKSGELTPQEAMKRLAEDFGEDFVRMIELVAKSSASDGASQALGDRLSKLEQNTQGVIDHLSNNAQRAHFQEIYDQHPDFQAVGEEPGFQEFVASTGQQAVVDNGSAAAINKLITDYKASKQEPAAQEQQAAAPEQAAPSAAPVDPAAADAAEGVRSAGLRLPDKPAKANDDFASAWHEF